MPVVLNPGPDGGRPLAGVVMVRLLNEGGANRFGVSARIYDADGKDYSMDAVAHELGKLMVWDGSVEAGAVKDLEVRLSGGPYLPVKSRASVVLEWTSRSGTRGSLRTPQAEILGTY